MNVLSLFDWISCARVALDRAWIKVHKYFASEIDKYAIQVAQKNRWCYYNNLWDITELWLIMNADLTPVKFDLLIWWSPCQDLSIAKAGRKWLDWEKSWLFWEYVRILKEAKPKYFILENVASMAQAAKDEITKALWVEPIMINASLVSAQNRKRLFWTNINGVTQPEDKKIFLKDVLEFWENAIYQVARWFNKWWIKENKAPTMNANCYQENNKPIRIWHYNSWWQWDRIYSIDWKSVCLSANWWWRWAKTWLYKIWEVRKLTPIECERLQWLSDNYTQWVSNSQRYKMIWNAFNVDVVSHILSFIPSINQWI